MLPHPRRRHAPPALLVASALLALAVTGVTVAPARVVTLPRCGVLSLLGELRNPTAGAGQRFATLVLTNVTRHTCTLAGYPRLRLLDARNRPLPTHVVRVGSRTSRVVRLGPGDSARSDLRWGAIPGPGEPQRGRCEPRPARVAVVPPGIAQRIVVPWRLGSVCEHGTIEEKPLR